MHIELTEKEQELQSVRSIAGHGLLIDLVLAQSSWKPTEWDSVSQWLVNYTFSFFFFFLHLHFISLPLFQAAD